MHACKSTIHKQLKSEVGHIVMRPSNPPTPLKKKKLPTYVQCICSVLDACISPKADLRLNYMI